MCVFSGVFNSLQPMEPTRLLRPWDFPGKNTGVGCHFLLQGIFPNQGLNYFSCGSSIGRQILYQLSHQGGSEVKASAYNAGDLGSIPGLERSPGEGNGNPLQYSCLENPMDGEAW